MTATLILVVTAFFAAVLNAFQPARVPLWVSVILLCVAGLLEVMPK